MPDTTTILSLPLILPAQAQKHVTHNEALATLDLIVQLAVINRTLTTAPALPALGDRHIVAAAATGPWAGQSGKIALFSQTGWQFSAPLIGWQAHVLAEGQTAVYDGLVWKTPAESPLIAPRLGVSATPDATNRLSVSSPATLFNHAGAGHQLKLNKALATDTASLLFQTGFSGRAEMGTAGTDDFSVKVSVDGSTYNTALVAAAASGEVTLPKPVKLGGQAADPGTPGNGTLWLNTTTGDVKVRSAGVTVTLGASGGVTDGDKGDITVSGTGAVWSIDAQAVTLSKMADLASSTLLGRATVGAGVAEALTPAQVRTLLNVAAGATANSADVVLLARANHTGTQLAATISDFSGATRATDLTGYTAAGARLALAAGDTVLGAFGKVGKWLTDLAAVAFSGSASDLTAGTLPAARFDDTAHGARAGGTLHANVVAAGAAGFMTGADKARLDGVSGTNTGDQTITLTGDVTGGGTGSFAATIAAAAVTLAQMANVATGTVFYRKTAGTGAPEVQTLGTLKTDLGLTGTNSGDQTSIVGLTGTKAQFDTAVTDGNILFVGDVTTNATHTGDATGATVLTLATVNANVGSFGLAGSVAQFVVNAKGLITSAANVAISVAATAISDSTAAGRAMLTAATATAQTALLDVATAALKGLMSGADKTKLDGVATGATANSADATLLARANHTGTQLAATISDATLAGHAMLTAATTAAQTALLDAATTTLKGLLTGTDKTKLDGVATGATANSADATLLARANHTGTQLAATISDLATAVAATAAVTANTAKVTNATHTGEVTGAGALTIAANAVDNTKAADMATARIKGRVTAATGDPEDLTGTQTTTLLDPFTSLLKGLVPASGGGTTNFIRADGVWAPPAGGGDVVGPASATDNALARFDLATGKLIKNSVNPASNAGEIGFPFVASPATPPASQVNLYGTNIALNGVPGFVGPDGVVHTVQSDLGEFSIARFAPQGTTGAVATDNSIAVSVTGVATATVIAPTNLHAMMRRVELLVTTAAATAVAGLRAVNNQWRVGKSAAAPGGFLTRIVWGPATGVATTTNRAFCGMRINAAPTDVEPSSLLNIVGMGWDAADTNIQMMYNDGTGTATKVDLGASFPVPTVDRQEVYELQLFSPSSLTQSVSYRVIRYNTTDKTILAQASGTLTTDLPVVTQLLVPAVQMSVGGTSSVIGVAVMGILVATAY